MPYTRPYPGGFQDYPDTSTPLTAAVLNTMDQGIVDAYDPDPYRPGEIIEILSSPCDGSSVTVLSGAYTVQNVTGAQGMSTSYQDINGSTISYIPPAGTNSVIYEFQHTSYSVTTHDINHYIFLIDGVEVVYARHNRSAQYNEQRYTFTWTINIGGLTNNNTGRQASWTTSKTLKMQSRQYGTGNYQNLHGTRYWNGAGGNQFSMPCICIKAVA